jgi:hypothetical protein
MTTNTELQATASDKAAGNKTRVARGETKPPRKATRAKPAAAARRGSKNCQDAGPAAAAQRRDAERAHESDELATAFGPRVFERHARQENGPPGRVFAARGQGARVPHPFQIVLPQPPRRRPFHPGGVSPSKCPAQPFTLTAPVEGIGVDRAWQTHFVPTTTPSLVSKHCSMLPSISQKLLELLPLNTIIEGSTRKGGWFCVVSQCVSVMSKDRRQKVGPRRLSLLSSGPVPFEKPIAQGFRILK